MLACILGSLGVAFILTNTWGPFGLCFKFREMIIAEAKKRDWPEWVSEGVQCPICVGFWTSIPVAWYTQQGIEGWLASIGAIALMIWAKSE